MLTPLENTVLLVAVAVSINQAVLIAVKLWLARDPERFHRVYGRYPEGSMEELRATKQQNRR